MTHLFITVFNIAISVSWLIAAVCLIRLLIKKIAPKWTVCLLWSIVAIRLIMPFTIESPLSIIPSNNTINSLAFSETSEVVSTDNNDNVPDSIYPESEISQNVVSDSNISADLPIHDGTLQPLPPIDNTNTAQNGTNNNTPEYIQSGFDNIDNKLNGAIASNVAEDSKDDFANKLLFALSIVWVCGVAALLIYAAANYLSLKRRVGDSLPIDEIIRKSENVRTPFILGVFGPKIYLPYGLSKETEDNIIAHEHAHLKRLDHLTKPLAFVLLSVYWFNPLIWLAYILFCRDTELACDEKVVGDMSSDERKSYATALLECGTKRSVIAVTPVAFGEIGVKERVKNALNYKKPMFWMIIVAVILCISLAVFFLTSPPSDTDVSNDGSSETEIESSEDVTEDSETSSETETSSEGSVDSSDISDDGSDVSTELLLTAKDSPTRDGEGYIFHAIDDDGELYRVVITDTDDFEIGSVVSVTFDGNKKTVDETFTDQDGESLTVKYEITADSIEIIFNGEPIPIPEPDPDTDTDTEINNESAKPMQSSHQTPEIDDCWADSTKYTGKKITPIYIQMVDVDRLFKRIGDKAAISNADNGFIKQAGLKLWLCTEDGEKIDYVYTNSKGIAKFECTGGVYNIYFEGDGTWASKYAGQIHINEINQDFLYGVNYYRNYQLRIYHDIYDDFTVHVINSETKQPIANASVKVGDVTLTTDENGYAVFKPLPYYVDGIGTAFDVHCDADGYVKNHSTDVHLYVSYVEVEMDPIKLHEFSITVLHSETFEPISGVRVKYTTMKSSKTVIHNKVTGEDGVIRGVISSEEFVEYPYIYIAYEHEYTLEDGSKIVYDQEGTVRIDEDSLNPTIYVEYSVRDHTFLSSPR